ncbi:hypothetical protein [Romboutsia sp.]|uniref:hypothetical protein n=1 Tax=Romboutsia sp. TaxID=1965302 RepID=UPI003F2D36FC
MKNSKSHLNEAFAQLQDAQLSLKHALDNVEKQNNKRALQSTLSAVDEAVFTAANTVANYQDVNY